MGLEEFKVFADGREDLIVLRLLVCILCDLERVLGCLFLGINADHLGWLLGLVGRRFLEDHLD